MISAGTFANSDLSLPRWLLLFVVTTILLPVSSALPIFLVGPLLGTGDPGELVGIICSFTFGASGALGAGFGQYLLLRPRVKSLPVWLLVTGGLATVASGLGLFAGAWATGWIVELASVIGISVKLQLISWTFTCLTIGIAVGLGQWFLLRSRVLRAYLWIVLSASAWMILGWLIFGESCIRKSYLCY